ncbi:MAG: M24 family metallopeptidase [Candidatus Promineifilaceae bacterium]
MSQHRIQTLRDNFDAWQVDAVIISDDTNRRWLTGFTGSYGYVVVTKDRAVLATDGRYWAQARQQSAEFEIYEYVREPNALAKFITSTGGQRFGVEAEVVTLSEMAEFEEAETVVYRPIELMIGPARMVKSADEIAAIQAACVIADETMQQMYTLATVGKTERQLAWELESYMRQLGADKVAFDIIVASGPNGAKPHHRPSNRTLQIGDAITVDLGAQLNGFHSDLTRAFHLGDNPSDKFWEIYTLVEDANAAAVAGIRPNMNGIEMDKIARDVIAAADLEEAFKHSLGHGVGLDIHEQPRLSKHADETIIPVGTVFSIEPGVYLDGWSGIRIEDLVVLRENGVESLSHCPKSPIITVG